MTARQITIGLLWHSMNSGNLGVGALSIAHIDLLRESARSLGAEARFLVLCWNDPGQPYGMDRDIELV
ncbi:MAG: polysaccharide pyruvyl transferase family protein, partial [Pseudomonadota bacterium]